MSNGAPQPPLTPAALRLRMIQRATLVVLGAGLLIWGAIYFLQQHRQDQASRRQEQAKAHVILRPGQEAQDWRLKEGARIEELSKSIEQQTKAIESLREQLEQQRKQSAQQTGAPRPMAQADETDNRRCRPWTRSSRRP